MSKKQKLQVIKVPINGSILSKPQVFPRMPRLYLELIENKDKIKQDLVNMEYNPTPSNDNIKEDYLTDKKSKVLSEEKFGNKLDMLLKDNNSDISDNSSERSPSIASSITDLSIEENEDEKKKENEENEDEKDIENQIEAEIEDEDEEDELSNRLKKLLNDDSPQSENISPVKKSKSIDKYSRHRDKNGYSIPNNNITEPPTLAQLESAGGYIPKREMPDINQTNPRKEQEDEDVKRELLFKFDLLRKSYPGSSIPEFSIHTELRTLEKSYADCVRRLSLDSTVENYKTYLVYGFMGCEFIFGNFLGFDMQGFTQQQIISMHSYEKLLIELGEKSYIPTGSSWPIEIRLLFMIIMNAAFFIVSKMMMKKTGANLMGMINNMTTPKPPTTSGPKRKMKGPDINLDDIPEI